MRSKNTEFAAVKLPRYLVCGRKREREKQRERKRERDRTAKDEK